MFDVDTPFEMIYHYYPYLGSSYFFSFPWMHDLTCCYRSRASGSSSAASSPPPLRKRTNSGRCWTRWTSALSLSLSRGSHTLAGICLSCWLSCLPGEERQTGGGEVVSSGGVGGDLSPQSSPFQAPPPGYLWRLAKTGANRQYSYITKCETDSAPRRSRI